MTKIIDGNGQRWRTVTMDIGGIVAPWNGLVVCGVAMEHTLKRLYFKIYVLFHQFVKFKACQGKCNNVVDCYAPHRRLHLISLHHFQLRLVLLLVILEVGGERDVLLVGLKGVHSSFNE